MKGGNCSRGICSGAVSRGIFWLVECDWWQATGCCLLCFLFLESKVAPDGWYFCHKNFELHEFWVMVGKGWKRTKKTGYGHRSFYITGDITNDFRIDCCIYLISFYIFNNFLNTLFKFINAQINT